MATIKTAIMVQDSMSPALRSMSNACRILLNNFEDMRNATSNAVDIQALKSARNELDNTDMILSQIEQSARDANQETEKIQSNFNAATSSSNSLLNTVKKIAVAIGGITLLTSLFSLSDEMASNSARLSLIVDDGGSVEELENKIFAMANKTGTAYSEAVSIVSKLGIQAGENFNGTDEIIAFTELMSKNFAISGASVQEQTSAMRQLTQAMSAGKLQGDEFVSIMENAPLLAEAIATYTGKSKGELKELSSEGLITSDIIKNAMFSAAEQINNRYDSMPLTWSQVWTRMKNITIKALDPVLDKINELANNPQVQEMFNALAIGVSFAAQAILGLIEGVANLIDILEFFAPIIFGIVGAYMAFNIIVGIASGILGIMAIAEGIASAAKMLHAKETLKETAAQWGLNSALLACPITWIIIGIMALIVALAYLWFTNDKVAYAILYVWDALQIGIMTAGLGIKAVWYALQLGAMYLWLGIQTVVLGLMTAWYGFQTGVEAVCLGVLTIFQGLYNGIVDIVNGIIGALNKIPGVEIDDAEYANFADKAIEGMLDNVVDRNEELQDMVDDMTEINNAINESKAKFAEDLKDTTQEINDKALELNETRDDRVDNRNNWITSAADAIKDALDEDEITYPEEEDGTLSNIADDTSEIADNTETSEEDLKYLIDIAERETINRFTTASVNITMTNNNNINEEQDIDGIVATLAEKLEEELQSVADGVHT